MKHKPLISASRVAFKTLLFSFFFVLGWDIAVKAQDKFIRPITFLEGLPSQTIYNIHQGPKGYLYLGTDVGVYRYNGQAFIKIPTPESWDNNFDNLFHDSEGNLWVKNFANQLFKEKNGILQTIPEIQGVIQPLGGLKKFTIANNTLYVTLEYNLVTIDLSTFSSQILSSSQGEENMFFSLQENDNEVFFNNNQTIIDTNGKVRYSSPENSHVLEFIFFKDKVFGLNRSLEGEIFDLLSKQTLNKAVLPRGTYLYFFKIAGEELYLCTNKGLFTIDATNNKVSKKILGEKRVSDIIQDREGNLWISTLDDGLFFVSKASLFATELTNYRDAPRNNVLSLAIADDGHLLAGTNKGEVFRINKQGKKVQSYRSNLENEVEFIFFDKSYPRVYHTQGFFEYPSGNDRKEYYFSKKLVPDDEGNFLIATSTGAGLVAQDFKNIPKNTFKSPFEITSFSKNETPFLRLFEKRAKTAFFSEKYQKYYLGTSQGLIAINKDGSIQNITMEDNTPLIANVIVEDTQKSLWIGTQQKGLIAIKEDKVILDIPILEDDINVPVKKIHIEKNRLLLIGGNQLYEYIISSKKLRVIPISSTFKGINLNDLLLWDDRVWLATSEGLLWINLEDKFDIVEPNIYLRQVNSNDQAIAISSQLPYGLGNLEFQFDVLHFSSMGAYNLQFRINHGSGKSWQTLGKGQHSIVFAGLNSGNYQLEVRAQIGEKLSKPIIINFSVATPFWKTGWFIGTLGILIALLVWWYTKNYGRKLREKEAITSKLLQSQLTALRSQMNPHFLFNVVNAVQGLIFANRKEDASQYLGQFSDLMRKVLQQSDKQFVLLDEEIQLIDLYISLEKRRFEEEFEYLLDVDHQLEKYNVQVPSLIIQPFVENAVKHGLLHQVGEKKLVIRFRLDSENERVVVAIEDNGIGRGASQAINSKRRNHQAFATKAIENRMNLLNQSIKEPITYVVDDLINEKGIGIGTLVTISLPFTYDYSHISRR